MKRLLMTLTLIFILCLSAFTLTACQEPHVHTFDQEVVTQDFLANEATCTEKAKYYYSCKCGAKDETLTFESGEILGHSFIDYVYDNNATCTEDGTETATCDRPDCNEQDSRIKVGSALSHAFINYNSNSSATCVENATEIAVCDRTDCQETHIREIPNTALNHNYGNWVSNGDGTHTQTCANDNSHKITKGCNGGEATCTEKATCKDCGAKYGKLADHKYIKQVAEDKYLDKAVTCTSKAKYFYSCECGAKGTETFEYGEALNHNYGNWVSNGDGTHTQTCANDNSHKITKGCNGGEATCTEKATCNDCGAKYGELKNHTYSQLYNFDKTHHWQDATCGCDLKQNNGEHTPDSSGICAICEKHINPTEGVLYDYSSDGTYIEVIGYVGTATKVKIADTYDNLPVKAIYAEAFKGTNITSIEIPDSVTRIGEDAFFNCDSLTSIVIPEGVTSIGSEAFYGCSSLTSIEISASVTSIGASAFYNCSSLTSIEIPNSVTSIGYDAFYNCSSLTSIEIPDSVTSIGDGAFAGCSSLTEVTIPNSVTSIGASAFYNCTSLTSIEIPNSVTSIGKYAFYWCSKLTSIEIPNSVTSIDAYAFSGCKSLTNVIFGENSQLTSIGSYAFNNCHSSLYLTENNLKYVKAKGNSYYILIEVSNNNFSTYKINSQTKYIAKDVFYGCSRLSNIIIPDSVTSIGYSAFRGCSSLQSITLPFVGAKAGVKDSDTYQYPFGYIFGTSSYTGSYSAQQYYYGSSTSRTTSSTYYIPSSLQSVTITGGNILRGAFRSCTSLTNIEISNSVTSIGSEAFCNCDSLTNIEISNSVTSIGHYAVDGCSNLEYNIEGNLKYLGNSENKYLYLAGTISIDINSATINDNCKFIYSSAFYNCSSLTSVIIGNSVTSIGSSAFEGCSSLTSIVIPNSVTSIGGSAFSGCTSLTSIEIPDSVTSIDGFAFYKCTSLTNIEIPASVTSIGEYAFYYCKSLTSIEIPASVTSIGYEAFYDCDSLTSIEIPASVTSIGYEAFYDCDSLTSIEIPNSVTSIGSSAFYDCDSLTSVTFAENSQLTSIGYDAFYGCNKLTSIVIPNSVTSIGRYAFRYCTSLTSIVFENPKGWGYSVDLTSTSGSISSSHLSNPSTAATYLKSTYNNYYLKRS